MAFDSALVNLLAEGLRDTLIMVLAATILGYSLGLPVGVLLAVTDKNGLSPHPVIYKVTDFIVNILRSVPFLILLIMLIPFTRLVVGQSYGTRGTIVPLTIAAAPFIARIVESSLKEVDPGVIEAARSMGASKGTIVRKVLIGEARSGLLVGITISLGTILGYSAMAGVIGGGGLGDIAIRYGYYRWETKIMLITVAILIILMQLLQGIGNILSKKVDKRK